MQLTIPAAAAKARPDDAVPCCRHAAVRAVTTWGPARPMTICPPPADIVRARMADVVWTAGRPDRLGAATVATMPRRTHMNARRDLPTVARHSGPFTLTAPMVPAAATPTEEQNA
ncbi:hypothetical protein [Sphingomonas montana]|uniref:hypothetical protein n=1 Tax=Sphingomonas montana TaxID=1843236 RepID=UPI00101AD953|nr:hypothetical protein [Sphingomonas montana]